VLLAGAVEVNALAQEALRQFTQGLRIEHPTFQLGGGHLTTELLPPPQLFLSIASALHGCFSPVAKPAQKFGRGNCGGQNISF